MWYRDRSGGVLVGKLVKQLMKLWPFCNFRPFEFVNKISDF